MPRKITIKRDKGTPLKTKSKMKQIKERIDSNNGKKPKKKKRGLA